MSQKMQNSVPCFVHGISQCPKSGKLYCAQANEISLYQQSNVGIQYVDSHTRAEQRFFSCGKLSLTTHNILWTAIAQSPGPEVPTVFIPLCLVAHCKRSQGIFKSKVFIGLEYEQASSNDKITAYHPLCSNVRVDSDSGTVDPYTPRYSLWKCSVCSHTNSFEQRNTIIKCQICGVKAPFCSASPSPKALNTNNTDISCSIQLSFGSGGSAKFVENLQAALKKSAWKTPIEKTQGKSQGSPLSNAETPLGPGLTGLFRRIELDQKKSKFEIDDSFSDLNKLIAKASYLTELAAKITTQLSSSQAVLDKQEEGFICNFFLNLGIHNPVTKDLVGADFHIELCKELCHLLDNILCEPSDDGNTEKPNYISLSDIYCLWNRARGSVLISPYDLSQAILYFSKTNARYRTKEFESGLIIITSVLNNDQKICARILELVSKACYQNKQKGLSALELSQIEKSSLIIAQEKLLMVEKLGFLCRDISLQGISFYPNEILKCGNTI